MCRKKFRAIGQLERSHNSFCGLSETGNYSARIAAPFVFVPFAVCDEVRFERDGKHILVGAYPGNQIVLRNVPGYVTCAVWTAFFALKPGRLVGEYQVKNDALVVASGGDLAFRPFGEILALARLGFLNIVSMKDAAQAHGTYMRQ
jgi:hypothetical protein